MTKKILILSLSFLSLMSFTTMLNQDHVKVNIEASTVKWIGSKITSSHEGDIKISSGKLVLEDGMLVGGEFVIDMTSMVCTDLKPNEGGDKLVKHLKADDFFGVENHPTSNLKITNVSHVSASNYLITADLTIKGITHPVDFNADVKINNEAYLATATLVFDRTKYGIEYNSGSFFDNLGDYLILDDITLELFLLSVK
jgi:polyisoprenoid-binding protein YceI|tara:strand:+ start:407 stop:1000 length:594 start_codon:yes stop_codon:yes gene_type:complete